MHWHIYQDAIRIASFYNLTEVTEFIHVKFVDYSGISIYWED